MSKHTPGPWHIGVRQPNSDKFIYGQNGEEIANCDRLTNFPDVNLANARLIAAAPELLEALGKIEAELSNLAGLTLDSGDNATLYDLSGIARTEIAKAKGES